VMDHGRVIADDTASALKSTLAGDVITLGFQSETDATAARTTLERVTGAAPSVVSPTSLAVTVPDGDRVLPLVVRALDALATAALRQPTLDDVFLSLTGRSLREDAATAPSEPEAEKVSA